MDKLIKTSCPRDCYDNCGIVVRRRDDGRLLVRGDPDHPINQGSLCTKCTTAYNGVWQDAEQRLTTPLRRVGAKGEGRFEPISWNEALATVAARLTEIVDATGPASVLHTHYSGTLAMLACSYPMRFFHRLGASEVEPDSICNLTGHIAWSTMFGSSIAGFDPRTAVDASTVVVWGANPSHSAPHMDKNWLGTFDGSVIVVDPIRTETAARANLHLQPFPGSDAALAFAILHELRSLEAFDHEFIADHVLGADELAPKIDQCTPEWGETETGVPAAAIREAARLYAEGPALLWAGQGLQRQPTGANIMRSIGLLPTLTGNIGKPGAGFTYLNVAPPLLGADFGSLEGAELAATKTPKVNHIGLAESLEDPARFAAFLSWNTNPIASAAEQTRLRNAMARDDLFTVVVECFATDTADYADIVLPAASFLEFDDLTFNYMSPIIGAQAKATEPLGQSLPNSEIFRRLSRAMGYSEPELYEPDDVIIERLLDEMGAGVTFDELKQQGHVYLSDEPLDFWAARRFRTPSKKIEIVSERAVSKGLALMPSPVAEPRPADGVFRLLSPASKWRLNDSHANDTTIARRSGHPRVVIHPADAAELAINEGDTVCLSNASGDLDLAAHIEDLAPRGVLLSHKGRWPKLETSGKNVNVLHEARSSDIEGSSAVHGTEVSLRPLG